MALLQPGDLVEDVVLFGPDGQPVRLHTLADGPLLLIFLRHLAWIPCRAHLGEVRDHLDALRARGARVVVVAQARPDVLAMHLEEHPYPFPVLSDPDRNAYRVFGLEQATWWKVLRPRVLLHYIRLMFRGWAPRMPSAGEDVLQLGGDFVVGPDRRLVYAHRSEDPSDRPAPAELLAAVERAADQPRSGQAGP